MPGHAHAAIQSMRVRHANGRKRKEFLLSDPDDKPVYKGVNDQQDTVINPCLESSFAFVEYVLSALKDMHQVRIQVCSCVNLKMRINAMVKCVPTD